jgi:glutaredoxin-like YruB-family protein
MKVRHIGSYGELTPFFEEGGKTFLLLYKSGNKNSDCALASLQDAAGGLEEGVNLLSADVNHVRDIHGRYGITSAPALLEFEGADFVKSVKGCQTAGYYQSFIHNTVYVSHNQEDRTKRRVLVYSTPTCPHCSSLKNYLRKNQIPFKDIDVSRDQKMAQELVRKSGQQGVPQTEIDGKIIVGFNKPRIDELLGLHS